MKIAQDGSAAFGRTQSWVSCIKEVFSESRQGRLKLQAKRVTHDLVMSRRVPHPSQGARSEKGEPGLTGRAKKATPPIAKLRPHVSV